MDRTDLMRSIQVSVFPDVGGAISNSTGNVGPPGKVRIYEHDHNE